MSDNYDPSLHCLAQKWQGKKGSFSIEMNQKHDLICQSALEAIPSSELRTEHRAHATMEHFKPWRRKANLEVHQCLYRLRAVAMHGKRTL